MKDEITIKKKDKFNINECECVKIKSNINKNNKKFLITDLYEIMTNFKIVLYFNEKITSKKLYRMVNDIKIDISAWSKYTRDDRSKNELFRKLLDFYNFNIITNLLLCSLIKKKIKIKKNKIIIPLFFHNTKNLYINKNFISSIDIVIKNIPEKSMYLYMDFRRTENCTNVQFYPDIINKITLNYLKGFHSENNYNKDKIIDSKNNYQFALYNLSYSDINYNNHYFFIMNNFIFIGLCNLQIIFMSITKKNKLIKFPNITSLTIKGKSDLLEKYYEIKKINLRIKNLKLYIISFGKFKKIKKQIIYGKEKKRNFNDNKWIDNIIINFDNIIHENYEFNLAWLIRR